MTLVEELIAMLEVALQALVEAEDALDKAYGTEQKELNDVVARVKLTVAKANKCL